MSGRSDPKLPRSGPVVSASRVYARGQAGSAHLYRSNSSSWQNANASRKQDKFISSFMKEKQQLRAPAPPIFGIFNPTTIGQIPFEVERRVERAKFEMELDLVEERKRSLAELNSKLKLGAEIHLQEQRELIIQRSRLLAENPPIFNRTVYYVIQEAEKMFEVPLDRAHDMFERFDAAEEMLSQEKRAQIRELVISFLQKYKDDLDETVQKDVSAERKRRLEAATSDAVHIAAHWEEVTRHDADALNETHLQDAKLQLECQREASFETTINHCSAAGSAVRHETATPNAFDIIGFSGNSDYALFKNRLFKPDSFFQKAMNDKDSLMARVKQYVNAVQSARVTTADVDYDEHALLRELRQKEQFEEARSLGNKSLDKFTSLYTDRSKVYVDENEGSTDTKEVYNALQRLRQLALQVELTQHRHTFALEKIRDDVLSSSGYVTFEE